MANVPKYNEHPPALPRADETPRAARGETGTQAEPEASRERTGRGDHSGDPRADRRIEPEASGQALRDQMASPIIASVTTMVCVTCGAEQFFRGEVPTALRCQVCGGSVFRAFDTPTERNEASIAQMEEVARSEAYGDSSPQTSPDEVRDLGTR